MISVKGGTQTWSNAPQQSSLKADKQQNLSAGDKDKLLQNEDIGDYLNKVADPNWVDPATTRKVGNNQLGKDAFMNLLLTQMKNQDPTNPLKSHEMAAQLAQFTSLEKLTNIETGLQDLRKDNLPSQNYQALALIGKTITTDNTKVSRVDGTSSHDVRFGLPADAQSLKMQIKDAAGNPIRNLDFKNIKSGKNALNWNGMTDDGAPAPAGEYTVAIEAVGSNGRKLAVEMKTEGQITGINFTPKGPQLLVGKQVIDMSDVKSISDSAAGQQAVTPLQVQTPAPGTESKGELKPETKPDALKRSKLQQGNLNDTAMAQGLINQLNKTGAKAGMSGS